MAYDSIVSLTQLYNIGKWNHIMDCSPRRLPVFDRVQPSSSIENMLEEPKILFQWNGTDCIENHLVICEGIGYEGKAVSLDQGQQLSFDFEYQSADSLVFEVCLLPNAIRRVVLKPQATVNHRLKFKALDEGVVLDQIKVFTN